MAYIGRDLKDHPVPTPLPWTRTRSMRPASSGPHPIWPSRDGPFTSSLGSLFQCQYMFQCQYIFPYIRSATNLSYKLMLISLNDRICHNCLQSTSFVFTKINYYFILVIVEHSRQLIPHSLLTGRALWETGVLDFVSVCYQHYSHPKFKTQHYASY